MALTPRLDIKQSQSLVLTPQLQQAIKMLQLSSAELVEFVAEEVAQNPLLEYDERDENEDRRNANNEEPQPQHSQGNDPEETRIKTSDDFLQQTSSISDQNDAPLDTDYSDDMTTTVIPII